MPGLVDVTPPPGDPRDITKSSTNIHRDRIYIVKDIVLKLVGHINDNAKKRSCKWKKSCNNV